MTRTQASESIGRPEAQRIERPRPSFSPQDVTVGLASQWLGSRIPAQKAVSSAQTRMLQQAESAGVSTLAQRRETPLRPAAPDPDLVRRNREALALLDEWMSEPDDLGEEWWAEFERELQDNRFHIPERE